MENGKRTEHLKRTSQSVCKVHVAAPLILLWNDLTHILSNSNAGNPGRSYDATVDLTEALKDHYNPELVKQKLAEVHGWLNKDAKITDQDRAEKGWSRAYNLTTWGQFPGKTLTMQVFRIIFRNC